MEYFDGRKIRDQIIAGLKEEIGLLGLKPNLAIIWVGEDFATARYIEAKQRAAEKIGVHFDLIKYSKNSSQSEIEKRIGELNGDSGVDGIMIQIPVPEGLDMVKMIKKISPEKDVDALRFCSNFSCGFRPPVTMSIMEAIKMSGISYQNKSVAVIGKGFLVGSPMVRIFEGFDTDLRIGDQKTPYLGTITADADIIISATGKANLIKENMVKEGVVLIDAGTTEVGGKLAGDIDKKAYKKSKFYTPVPGGIGPVTVAMLLKNVVEAAKRNRIKNNE